MKVSLNCCTYSSGVVIGVVTAENMHCAEQSVSIRFTTDNWTTFKDTCTSAICSGFQDDDSEKKYAFEIDLEGQTNLEFAICLRANDALYWDNNNTKNYALVLE